MRSTVDVIRSVAAHLARAMGDEFTVVLSPSDGEYDPPTIRIELLDRTAGGPSGRRDHRRQCAVAIHLGEGATPHAALLDGYRVEGLLIDALEGESGGTPFRLEQAPVGAIRTARGVLPLWDYSGIGADESSTIRGEHDFVRVSNLSTRVMVDRDEDRYVSITGTCTLAWRQPIGAHPTTPILGGAPLVFEP